MNPPIISDSYQRKKDSDHLNLLSIFYFVAGGLALLGIGFLLFHYRVMHAILSNPELWKGHKNPPPFSPSDFWRIFIWFYPIMGLVFVVESVLNLLCGLFLRQRKHRTFSMVVAGINCIQVPLGTVLGVFTLIVLMRDSVRDIYGAARNPPV